MYQQQYGIMGGRMTPGVRMLLTATVAAFLLQIIFDGLTGGAFTMIFSLSRAGIGHLAIWQPITYMFLHGGLWHILINMLGLFFFGPETERFVGTRRFLWLYFGCGVAAGIGWLLISGRENAYCLGASGAVFGVLGAFAAFFPERPVTLLLFFVVPITMRARTLAIGLGLINLFSMINAPGQVAYAAHLAGGLVGYGYGHFSIKGGFEWKRLLNPLRWWHEVRWHWRRRKFQVLSSSEPPPEDEPPDAGEVDRILDKVAREGMRSLSRQERETLERASKRPF